MSKHVGRRTETLFDMSHVFLTRGNAQSIAPGKDTQYTTHVLFVAPLNPEEFKPGVFTLQHEGTTVRIKLWRVESAAEDPIYQIGKDWSFGASIRTLPSIQTLPFEVFTDNRHQYPCVCADIVFPFRLANWADPSHPSGIKMDHDLDEVAITGPPLSKDKIAALKVLNKLLKSPEYGLKARPVQYDDVTVFLEVYYRNWQVVLQRLAVLASRYAYKDALAEYFLGDGRDSFLRTVSAVAKLFQDKPIRSEDDLLEIILHTINDVIRHHVEHRDWIEPFWDGSRQIKHNDALLTVPAEPKNEIKIQPTLYVLLHEALTPLGIHVVMETHEGVGSLDFKCVCTTSDGDAISVPIEFKLAHHGKIRKGLTAQLPAYMQASGSNTGIFLVMWFKDQQRKVFNRPKRRQKEEMLSWLQQTASEVQQKTGLRIIPIIIDASVRPSASAK